MYRASSNGGPSPSESRAIAIERSVKAARQNLAENGHSFSMEPEQKTAEELQTMIMDRLHEHYPQCDDFIIGVVVQPAGEGGGWIADTTIRHGATVPADCYRIKSSITAKLRKQYDLACLR
jgi:hypothetical protein